MTTHKAEKCWKLPRWSAFCVVLTEIVPTSFFLARSPEAPKMTRTVFSGISNLGAILALSRLIEDCQERETRCLVGDGEQRPDIAPNEKRFESQSEVNQ